jgi:hypothetical protein
MPWPQLGARKPGDACGLTQTSRRARKTTRSTRASVRRHAKHPTLPRRGTDNSTNTIHSVRAHKGVSQSRLYKSQTPPTPTGYQTPQMLNVQQPTIRYRSPQTLPPPLPYLPDRSITGALGPPIDASKLPDANWFSPPKSSMGPLALDPSMTPRPTVAVPCAYPA